MNIRLSGFGRFLRLALVALLLGDSALAAAAAGASRGGPVRRTGAIEGIGGVSAGSRIGTEIDASDLLRPAASADVSLPAAAVPSRPARGSFAAAPGQSSPAAAVSEEARPHRAEVTGRPVALSLGSVVPLAAAPAPAAGVTAEGEAPRSSERPAPTGLAATASKFAGFVSRLLASPFGRGAEDRQAAPVSADAPRSLADISLDVDPDRLYTPSPQDWRDHSIYTLVTDRFERARPYFPLGDPASLNARHGGNLRGLMKRLDYIKDSGLTTLLISPVAENPADPLAYHGYWPINFLAVDPHLGTMEDLQELVRQAHARGLRVVLDLVLNHTGPVLEYNEGFQWDGMDGPPKTVKRWKYPLAPAELAREENFHRRGSIDDWHDPDQLKYGDFPSGLNHLTTENPGTQDVLIKISQWWLKQTDVDGVRLDTYQHIAPSFWERYIKEMNAYAAKLGKENLLWIPEIYHGDPRFVAKQLEPSGLNTAYNYPAYFADEQALHGEAPTSRLEESFHALKEAFGASMGSLIRFLDNPDKPRFLRQGDPVSLLKMALAYAFFSIGFPLVYYGTEQAFRQADHFPPGMDSYREDMFAQGRYKNPADSRDNFNKKSEVYRWIQKLAALRGELEPLRRGEQHIRWSDPNGPGIFAFSRIYRGQEALVVINTAAEARSAQMWVDNDLIPADSAVVDKLDDSFFAETFSSGENGGSKLTVDVPPHGVRVIVRR